MQPKSIPWPYQPYLSGILPAAPAMLHHFPSFEIDLANLRGIVEAGGLRSDVAMAEHHPEVIGYDHIKKRRTTEIRMSCCGDRFVGEFVPCLSCLRKARRANRSPSLMKRAKRFRGQPPKIMKPESTIPQLPDVSR